MRFLCFAFCAAVEETCGCRDKRENRQEMRIKFQKGSFKVLLSLCQHFAHQTITAEIELAGDRRTNTSVLRAKVTLSRLRAQGQ